MHREPSSEIASGYARDTLAFERVTFFSDAVIAIAITLLAIEIRLPEVSSAAELAHSLLALWPRYLSFAISFLVIGSYWAAHHRKFTYLVRIDQTFIFINFLYLGLVAFMPFSSGVVGEYGNKPVAQAFYAGSVALTGLVLAGLWRYASHNHRLVDSDLSSQIIQTQQLQSLAVPLLFLISVPLVFVNFVIPIVVWLLAPIAARWAARYFYREREQTPPAEAD